MHRTFIISSIAASLVLAMAARAGDPDVRRFEATNHFEVHVPDGNKELRGWFALPDDRDSLQDVGDLKISASAPEPADVETREVRDGRGNRFLYLVAHEAGGLTVTLDTGFRITRRESVHVVDPGATRPLTEAERKELHAYLEESSNVVTTPEIRTAAAAAVGDEDNPLSQARRLYDWTLDHVQYWVKFPDRMKSSGVGSSTYCYEQCTGNCTDFHSLYAAAARSVGLPTRMVYGSFFKSPLDGKDQDQSYHCWIEFFAPELGWTPLDVAIADVFVDDFELNDENRSKVELTVGAGYSGPDSGLVDYYFGNLDARRVTWNRGRDLVLDPTPVAGPINALPKAHVEADGVPLKEGAGWTRKLTFTEIH